MGDSTNITEFLKSLPELDPKDLIPALEHARKYYYRYFPQHKLVVVPPATMSVWNCKPYYENVPQSICDEMVADSFVPEVESLYRAIDDGELFASDVIKFKDGTTWVRLTLVTTKWDDSHNPIEAVAIAENLSATKAAEDEIAEQNKALIGLMQVFQVAAEATGTIVFIFDTERQSILVSDTTADRWGVLTEQFGVPYETAQTSIVDRNSREEYIRIHEEMMHGAREAHGRVALRDADGNLDYYELTFRALLDEHGNPTGKAAGIYKNVTDLQEHYIHQAEMNRALSEGVESVFYADFDRDSYIIENLTEAMRVERQDISMLVQNEEKCLSETMRAYCAQFVHPDDYDRMRHELNIDTIKEKLHNRKSYYIQYRIRNHDANHGYFEMHIADASHSDGEHKAFLAFRSIDEQKEREIEQRRVLDEAYRAADRANSAKMEFMARMSHDIRTPLNAIIGMTAIAEAHTNDAEKISYCLSQIHTSSKFLLGLVNEVLDMNRIESGKVSLNVEAFHLDKLLADFATIAQPLADGKKHTFTIDASDVQHRVVLGDKERIAQCLMNFMSNAVKYTPPGGEISLTVHEKVTNRPKRGCYEFVFKDNGIGMAPEFIKTVFEPFARAEDERVTEQQGTGLGMAITRTIIQMMNGDVRVESELNKGSTFTATVFLELPDEEVHSMETGVHEIPGDAAAGAETGETTLKQYTESDFRGSRILLVEDNEINAEIAIEIMGMTGLVIDHAWNGVEAVAKMNEVPDGYYRMVFMDIQMPVMNGYDAVKEIRASSRKYLREVPIIAMSANAFAEDVRMAKLSGMNDHIAKPLDFDRLMHLLQTWLPKA